MANNKIGLHKESRILVQTKNGEREIQLYLGDITSLPMEESVDVILISAFPYDYAALRTSVIGALKVSLGIDVNKLSRSHMKEDLRKSFHCWISRPLPGVIPYRQLICFEHKENVEKERVALLKAVEGVFRAMMPLFNNQSKSVITPLLATGFQTKSKGSTSCPQYLAIMLITKVKDNPDHIDGTLLFMAVDKAAMVKEMIKAAVSWMLLGLPLQTLKIVVYSCTPKNPGSAEKSSIEMFHRMKSKIESKPVIIKEPVVKTDIFLVYCESDKDIVAVLREQLAKSKQTKTVITLSDVKVKDESWKHDIFMEMLSSARIVPVLSPNFLKSEICVDQYNVALCCNRFAKRNILAPLCLERFDVPLYMSMVQWINCRDRDEVKVKEAAVTLREQIKNAEHHAEKEYDVFLSYCHKNLEYANQVMKLLQRNGQNLKIFFDYAELKTGVSWQQALYHALDSSRCVLSLVSKDYMKSDVCKEEYNLAVAKHYGKGDECKVVAVVIESHTDELLHFLGDLPYLDCSDSSSSEVNIHGVCKAMCTWLSTGQVHRQVFGPDRDTVDISVMTSLKRKQLFHQLYSYNKTESEFTLTTDAKRSLTSTSQNSKDSGCDVFISSSLWDQHCVQFVMARLKKYHPELRLNEKLESSEETQISEAKCCLVVLSAKYLESPKEVEELNLILSRQRGHKERQIMYILKVGELPPSPFYPQVLEYDTCLTDELWSEFVFKTLGTGANGEQWVENIEVLQLRDDLFNEFKKKLQGEEIAAMLKCVCDLDAVLKYGRYRVQVGQNGLFINTHTLSKDLQQDESPISGEEGNIFCSKKQQTYDESYTRVVTPSGNLKNEYREINDEQKTTKTNNEYQEINKGQKNTTTDDKTKAGNTNKKEKENSNKPTVTSPDSEKISIADPMLNKGRFDGNKEEKGSNSDNDKHVKRKARTSMCMVL